MLNYCDERTYLAGAKEVFPYVNAQSDPLPPKFAGSCEEFIEKYKDNAALKNRMLNKVKKCGSCGKPNGFTLATCNQCGGDIAKTQISHTNNVFTSFLYGIQKGPFPFTISVRFQSADYLVFDDLLSLTPCHLNSIPATHFVPDWRYLLSKPKEGLEILNNLFETCWSVVQTQFLVNQEWAKKIFKGSVNPEELKKSIIAGFNYPPSQYQLHLQFMVPPLLPNHYLLYLNGVHYTYGRFIPLEYAKAALEFLVKEGKNFPVTEETSPQQIFDHFTKNANISYDAIHSAQYARYGELHKKFSNWDTNDFQFVIVSDKVHAIEQGEKGPTLGKALENVDAKEVTNKDKQILQNYGRPYVGGKPSGTYYKFARVPGDETLPDLKEW